MLGLVTAVGNILGALTGLAPKVMEMWEKDREHKREREREAAQHAMQLALMDKQASVRTIEAENATMMEEVRAWREAQKAATEAGNTKSGVAWIDGWNAMLRPMFVSLVMAIFTVVAFAYLTAVVASFWSGALTPKEFMDMVWGSFIGYSIEATLGYLFGYRNVVKKLGA